MLVKTGRTLHLNPIDRTTERRPLRSSHNKDDWLVPSSI